MFNSLKIKRLTSKMRKLLLVEKDYNKTIECANEILELDENNLFALKCKSDALRQLGDFEGALENFNKSIELSGNTFAHAFYNLGYLYSKQGDIEKAKAIFEKRNG